MNESPSSVPSPLSLHPSSPFTLHPSPSSFPLPERSFQFAVLIVNLCQKLDQIPGVARTLSKQILRSGTSIGANIEEGQASQSEADFLSKYGISCKEARETLYWLRLLRETQTGPSDPMAELIQECNELVSILTTIVKKLKEKSHAR